MFELTLLLASFLAAAGLMGSVRRHALQVQLLDVPNRRSAHSSPIPRGGGLAIVGVTLAATGLLRLGGTATALPVGIYLVGGFLVAGVGYLDDCSHVRPQWRLLVHLAAATPVVLALGRVPPMIMFGYELNLGIFTFVLEALFIVGMVNIYNFMDGIDGIAGLEAVTGGGAASGLLFYDDSPNFAVLAAVLVMANLGFLIWNWPPAKIFMGDVGSGFLGFCFGSLAVVTTAISPRFTWMWLILLGVFLVDATVTLFRRMLRREKLYRAHRSHAYQYASRKFGSHLPVTIAVGVINLFWLLPLAFLVVIGRLDGLLGMLIAYTPLLVLALHFKAGARETEQGRIQRT